MSASESFPGSSSWYSSSTNMSTPATRTEENTTNLLRWSLWYSDIHGYVAAVVCVFGVIANILNIIVLTRKNMQSPTNIILTGLAISDGLTMAAYFPFALQQYCIHGPKPSPERDTLPAARFLIFYATFSVVMHTISIWLTVTLALFRYISIKFPRKGARYCNIYRAKMAVILVSIVTTIVCIPNSASLEIKEHRVIFENGRNASDWYVDVKKNSTSEIIVKNLNFWMQALLVKILPCIFLTILSILLVKTMKDVEKRRKKLLSRCSKSDEDSGRERKTNRTTRMLLSVVILFLLTEIPQGIMNLLSGIIDHFFYSYYMPLGDVIDILALINNGINFILYCTMSKQFRDTFIRIFFKNVVKTDDRQLHLVSTQATKYSEV